MPESALLLPFTVGAAGAARDAVATGVLGCGIEGGFWNSDMGASPAVFVFVATGASEDEAGAAEPVTSSSGVLGNSCTINMNYSIKARPPA